MPAILIETRTAYSEAQETALLEAVHLALREAFRIPEWDRNLRLSAHAPHRFACPPGLARPERYTQITIDAFAGRSLDAKRGLYRAIVDRLQALDIPADHVTILLREAPRENWGIRGGQAACDVDLGFSLEV
jgi:phenylpyruvate tautomerase PptA (4-oxalocrotonate tautomerase family)